MKKTSKRTAIKLAQQPYVKDKSNAGPAPSAPVSAPNARPDYSNVNQNTGMIPNASTPFPAALGDNTSSPNGSATSGVEQGFNSVKKANTDPTGNSGTQIFGGYYSEEYLQELRGRNGAKKWDEIRRSESQVAMLLNAVMNPIKAANWGFEPFNETDPVYENHKDLVEHIMLNDIDFDKFKHEALTMIIFGFSLFERVDSVVFDHPKFGTYNGLKSLAFRSQKTIENWQLEQKTGVLMGVNQYTYSDLGGNQFIPGDFLVVFSLSQEGDNYEGISALRSLYGAYNRKELYLKLAAIGIEKYAVGTPIGTVPKGKEKTLEYQNFVDTLMNYTSHESAFITLPEGWDIKIETGGFDADKITKLLIFENTEMINAFVANFLALGTNGSGGAYSLGSNLGEFFTTGIQAFADLICSRINKKTIPDLIKANFGEQQGYPKMKVTGISDKAGKEFAEAIKMLSDARAIDPDQPLKDFIRKQYKLPKPDPTTAVALPAIPAGGSANYPKPNSPVISPETGKLEAYNTNQLLNENAKTIKLADSKYVAKFDKNKATVKALMQDNMSTLFGNLKTALTAKYNSLSGSDKILAAKGVDTPGVQGYKIALREALSQVAKQSYDAAKATVPKSIKLAEAKKLSDIYDALPPYIRKLVDAQTSLIVDSQVADMEKIVFFTFTSTATTTQDVDTIMTDVDEKFGPTLDGSTSAGMSLDAAAGDAVAHVTQQASLSLLFSDDVIDSIESFTFTNEDPQSECCQALAGTTFAVGDPDLDRYTPPLHHNCKSRYVPNYKDANDNPDIDMGGVSLSRKALDAMTLSERSDYLMSFDFNRLRK